MVTRPFYPGALLALSYAATPGAEHLTYKSSQCLVAIYRGLHSLVSLQLTVYSFYQGMITKHDKLGVLNPCDNNKKIVNKRGSDSCYMLLQDSMYTLQHSVLLITTHNKLTLRMNGSYELIPKELELALKLM